MRMAGSLGGGCICCNGKPLVIWGGWPLEIIGTALQVTWTPLSEGGCEWGTLKIACCCLPSALSKDRLREYDMTALIDLGLSNDTYECESHPTPNIFTTQQPILPISNFFTAQQPIS